jgi:hypothetical protein
MQAPCASDCSGGMSGIAEQNNAPFVPVPHLMAIHDRTAPAKVHHGVQGGHRRMSIAVNLFKPR